MEIDWTDFLVTSRKRHRIHLLGVAGSGMSGLAGLLLDLGHEVSGSDRVTSLETERLQRHGLQFDTDQKPEQLEGKELVIYSSAVRPGHSSLVSAAERGIPLLRRAAALAAILRSKKGILVAGTHGKTTTSAMIAHLLRVGGLHPSHYVGAEIPVLGTNARWDPRGEWFVAEGDESDGTLRLYQTAVSVILNIEADHLDYYQDLAAIEDVFAELVHKTTGAVIACADDAVSLRVAREYAQRNVTFGGDSAAVIRFANVSFQDLSSTFDVISHGKVLGRARLGVPGRHNVSNATAAVAVALEVGLGFDCICEGLATFEGARRRIEVRYRSPQFMVVDDYGHHPTEVKATLAAVKECGRERISVIFQPHRYSRTAALREDFASAFGDATRLWLAPVYAAGEEPIEGADAPALAAAIQAEGHPNVKACGSSQAARLLAGHHLFTGDLLLTLGAGNIHLEAAALARDLQRLEQLQEAIGRDKVRLYEPMAPRTTLRVGGVAQFFAEPERATELAALLRYAGELGLPWFVIGRGSNLLVRDGGIPGLVISLSKGEFVRMEVEGENIRAGAGVRFKQIASAAKSAGLGGFEWMDGIPGTVGGGLRMNAGAMGSETFDQVLLVRTMDGDGRIFERHPVDLQVTYRKASGLEREIALDALFHGYPDASELIQKRLDASFSKRKTTQPIAASAGCIFRNPPELPAGKLIEELGLKNQRVGRAIVSPVHGNFIVNEGEATAADVLGLIQMIQEKAACERAIILKTEVQIVGEETPSF